MSKTNGDNTTQPDDLRAAAELAIKLTTEATDGPYRIEQSGNGKSGKYLQRVIRAAKNWRRRPVPGAKTWPEFDDVATIMGGMSEQAKNNGEMLAAAPELLKMLARGVLELQASTHNDKLKPAIGGFTPTKTVVDWYYFLSNAANALDCLIEPDHKLGKHPVDAMLGGSTEDRKNRAAVLRALADTIDPLHDEARKRAKHPSERLNGTPTVDDFLRMLPDTLREVLHMAVTCEAEMEIARLDLIAQRRWELPSNAVRLYVRARMAEHDAWWHFENHHVPNPAPDQSLEGLDGDEYMKADFDNWMRRWKEKKEFYKDDIAALVYQIANDFDWLRENKDTEDAIFDKIMSTEPTDHGPLWDLDLVINNWDFAPCT